MNPFDRLHALAEQGDFSRRVLRRLPVGRSPIPRFASVRTPTPALAPGRRPTVSVVIPCYNYAHFLPDAIYSSLDQAGVTVEVIVVDDGSTDDSACVAQRIAKQDERVQVLQNAQNVGHVATFNNGFEIASGEFIVRLDADDLLTPGSLRRAVELFDAFPGVGLVYGSPRHFTSPTPPEPEIVLRGWTVWSGQEWFAERCRVATNCITTPEAIVRTAVMREVGPLDTRLHYAQDMEMWLRVAIVSDVGHIDGPDQALHRDHATSMSVTVGGGVLTDLTERRAVFDVLFDGPAKAVSGGDELYATARRILAAQALDRACRAYNRGRAASEPVSEYVAFALETYPAAKQLSQWQALEASRRVSTRAVPILPASAVRAVARRAGEEWRYLRWQRTGV